MKPAWDSLAKEYANSDKLIVADVDCTAEGKDLCEKASKGETDLAVQTGDGVREPLNRRAVVTTCE